MCYNASTHDQVLVSAYLNGDESAFAFLLRRYQSKIFGKIYMVVRDRAVAEDIFQDTLMKAVFAMKSGGYNEEGKFLPWVMRIAHNLCIDHFRLKKKLPIQRGTDEYDPISLVTDNQLNVEEGLNKKEVLAKTRRLLDVLPDEQKEIVLMRIYLDMSFKEIADRLDISINTALGRMRYALINLRKHVDQHHLELVFEQK